MTDDLLKRLVDWDEYDEGKLNDMREEAKDRIEKLTERNQELALDYLAALGQSADRIEALTAERDHAWAMVAKADTQMGQSLADHMQAKAERDRLREALERIAKSEPRSKRSGDYDRADVSTLQRIARTALKGETP